METNRYPKAKDVINAMDGMLNILGFKSQNDKPWQGYYNGKVNLSFTEAKDLVIHTFSASYIERVIKEPFHADTYLAAREYLHKNPHLLHATALVYHKNKKKISLQGYNSFLI